MRSRVRRRTKSRPLSPSTGIWNLAYDANNRPISFTSEDGQTVIACDYDYMGRRFMKKITIGGSITVHQRYLYRGYLQIAALDLTNSQLPVLSFIHWDPTEASATRPLSIRKNETWYSYGQDLTKNVTELYKADGTIASSYDYTPYGAVTATGIEQPLQWSSEIYDSELGLVYYNYRHYNPRDGRWINRDPIAEQGGINVYDFLYNSPFILFDVLGLASKKPQAGGDCTFKIEAGHWAVINKREREFKDKQIDSASCTPCDKYYGVSCFRTPNKRYLWPTQKAKEKHLIQRKKPDGTNAALAYPSDSIMEGELVRVITKAEEDAVKECSNTKTCCSSIELIVSCRDLDPQIEEARNKSRTVRLACSYKNTYTCTKRKKQGKWKEETLLEYLK